jgi:hypothetical protein
MLKPDNSERNARIIGLAGQGKGPAAIARELGLTPGVVLGVLHRARKVGPKAPTWPAGGQDQTSAPEAPPSQAADED